MAVLETEITSLGGRLAKIRRERQERLQRTFTIAVPGTQGLLAARCRRLSAHELADVMAHPGVEDDGLNALIDVLIAACVELLEIDAGGAERPLGLKWTTESVGRLFEIQFPPDTPVRAAVRQALDESDIQRMSIAWRREVDALEDENPEVDSGEFVPSVGG